MANIDGRGPTPEALTTNTNRSQGRSTWLAKQILLVCWFISVVHIWLASDGSDTIFDATDYDLLLDERLRLDQRDPTLNRRAHELPREEVSSLDISDDGDDDYDAKVDDVTSMQKSRRQFSTHETNISLMKLPEALHPITYNECCVPAIQADTYETPNDIKCFGTCFNERACTDPSYPYASMEEKNRYGRIRNLDKGEIGRMKERCVYTPEYLVPNVTWCSANHSMGAKSVYGNTPEPGCSHVTNGGGSGPWQHVFIFPSAKLAFCGIPKVGITQWIQFSRFVAGAKDYPSLPHYKMDNTFFRFDKLETSIQREIWTSKEWTWAVFLREPAERLLSAYLNKISKVKTQGQILDALGSNSTTSSFTFNDFVKRLEMHFNKTGCKGNAPGESGILNGMTGLNWCSDPHWRPQIHSCGLFGNLDRFQFVGDIDNASDHAKALLETVGLWETHGQYFINGGDGKQNHMCMLKSHLYNHTDHVGFQQRDKERNVSAANTAYDHSKNSQDKMAEYYTPQLLKLVREKLYSDDYKLYNLIHGKKNLTDGNDLAKELSGTSC